MMDSTASGVVEVTVSQPTNGVGRVAKDGLWAKSRVAELPGGMAKLCVSKGVGRPDL